MEIVLNTATIIGVAGTITALGVIIGLLYKIFTKYKEFECHGEQIKALDKKIDDLNSDTIARLQSVMAEQCLQTTVLDAVLDGLEQLGCNHSVPQARKELNDYLNQKAHEVKEL